MKPPIFILGSGRSGSTLLQRALNVHSDIVIFGEHQGFLGPIANAYYSLKMHPDVRNYIYGPGALPPSIVMHELSDYKADICWINNFTETDVDKHFRSLLLGLLAKDVDIEDKHWGFKEIRYNVNHRVIWFLTQMFPSAKFVVLTRHPVDTISSAVIAWHIGHMGQQLDIGSTEFNEIVDRRIEWWTNIYLYLEKSADEYPNKFIKLRYEDLVSDFEKQIKKALHHIDTAIHINPNVNKVFANKVAATSTQEGRGEVVRHVASLLEKTTNKDFRMLCTKNTYSLKTR